MRRVRKLWSSGVTAFYGPRSVRAWPTPGFEDGRNVVIEFRWAEGQGSRLPATPLRQFHRNVL
jgi:hypothetical protein